MHNEDDVRAAYAAHGGDLFGFALFRLKDRGHAEECVQETFLRAWQARERFDPSIASLRTWLFAILRNVVIDAVRRRTARPEVAGAADAGAIEHPADEDLMERAMERWQVEEALRRLAPHHRSVIVATLLEDKRSFDVAAEQGVPEGTVRSRLYYGLRALRVELEEMGWNR